MSIEYLSKYIKTRSRFEPGTSRMLTTTPLHLIHESTEPLGSIVITTTRNPLISCSDLDATPYRNDRVNQTFRSECSVSLRIEVSTQKKEAKTPSETWIILIIPIWCYIWNKNEHEKNQVSYS
jgi:hypothetical protein